MQDNESKMLIILAFRFFKGRRYKKASLTDLLTDQGVFRVSHYAVYSVFGSGGSQYQRALQ